MSVVPSGRNESLELPEGALASDLVKDLDLPLAACLVLRDDRPIPIDQPLRDGDDLKVVFVASGG